MRTRTAYQEHTEDHLAILSHIRSEAAMGRIDCKRRLEWENITERFDRIDYLANWLRDTWIGPEWQELERQYHEQRDNALEQGLSGKRPVPVARGRQRAGTALGTRPQTMARTMPGLGLH